MKQERFDQIVEIDKFNPFHDNLGRFANKNGFSSYSANPKSKAGVMAIQRSHAGGHDRTLNVHRESKGESVGQNAKWLATGQKPKVPAATSRARYQQRKLEQQSSSTITKPKTQSSSNTTTTPSTNSQSTTLHVNQKMKSGATCNVDYDQSKVSGAKNKSFKGTAEGKDITKTFDATKVSSTDSYCGTSRFTNQVADMQGFNSAPKVVSKAEFDQLANSCGDKFYRTVGSGTLNGKRVTGKGFMNEFKNSDDLSMNGSSGRAYGDGIYTTSAKMNAGRGGKMTALDAAVAKRESQWYGDGKSTLEMTWLSKPNIVTSRQLNTEWNKLSISDQARFGNHPNTYACAKGYDAVYTSTTNYMVVFNRSKIAVCE